MRRRRLLPLPLLALPVLAGCEMSPRQSQAPVPVVFFTEDSAALGEEAKGVIAEAATRARANPGQPVTVLGFAGPAGSAGYNRALSDARARAVADALVADGVAPGRLSIRPRGEVPYEMIPTESRRVEIRIGG